MARTAAGPGSEERRQQIMEAALRVFADKGFASATTKDIAHEAGVTPGLIYHYFEDKRAVFAAIFVEHSPLGGAANVLATEDLEEIDPRVVLPLLMTNVVSRLEASENAPAFRLLMGESMRDPEMSAVLNTSIAHAVESLAGYLRIQMARGRLRALDPTLVAQLLLGSAMSCVIRRSCTGDPTLRSYTCEQIAATIVDMAMGGLEVADHHTGCGEIPAGTGGDHVE